MSCKIKQTKGEIGEHAEILVLKVAVRCTRENLQFAVIMNDFLAALFDRIIHLHDSSLITAPVAIVRGRKDCHYAAIVLPLVSFHYELVCSSNKVQAVNMGELLRNVLPKRVARTPR